jgi:hypothetical protein
MSRRLEFFNREFNGDAGTHFLNGDCEIRKRLTVGFTIQKEATVTKFKILSAIVILSAAVATPVFAQPTHHSRIHVRHFRGAYNRMIEPYDAPASGFSGRDPSPMGGGTWLHPSDLNPSGS